MSLSLVRHQASWVLSLASHRVGIKLSHRQIVIALPSESDVEFEPVGVG